MILESLRKAYDAKIAINPTVVEIQRLPLIPNGFGGYVQDFSGSVTVIRERVRISHEQGSVPAGSASPVGISTSFGLYALLPWNSQVKQGEEIRAGLRSWRVGVVDSLIVEGKVYGKRAPLTETSRPGIEPPTGFTATANSSSTIVLSWADFVGNAYSIERENGEGEFEEIASIASGVFTHTDTGLTAGTEYKYRLRAYDGTTWSRYTDVVTATTQS